MKSLCKSQINLNFWLNVVDKLFIRSKPNQKSWDRAVQGLSNDVSWGGSGRWKWRCGAPKSDDSIKWKRTISRPFAYLSLDWPVKGESHQITRSGRLPKFAYPAEKKNFHVPVIDGCQKVKMSIDDKKVGHFEGNASMDRQINRLSLVSSTSVEGSCQKFQKISQRNSKKKLI